MFTVVMFTFTRPLIQTELIVICIKIVRYIMREVTDIMQEYFSSDTLPFFRMEKDKP